MKATMARDRRVARCGWTVLLALQLSACAGIANEVRARRIVLVDEEGRELAILGQEHGRPSLLLLDAAGDSHIALGTASWTNESGPSEGPALFLRRLDGDSESPASALISVDASASTIALVSSEGGNVRLLASPETVLVGLDREQQGSDGLALLQLCEGSSDEGGACVASILQLQSTAADAKGEGITMVVATPELVGLDLTRGEEEKSFEIS